jgi:hypothetical protein
MRRSVLVLAASIGLLTASVGSLATLPATASAAGYHVYICDGWSNNQGPLVPAATSGMVAQASGCGGP